LGVTPAEKEQEVAQPELAPHSHSTEHLEHEKQSCLGAKLVPLLILNYEIAMNAKSIIMQTPSIKIMNKEEILLILFWPGKGPMIFNSDKTISW
jgi:hypothetical protein